ncbi:MAG: molybdate ABC transporter permease subunit, partial [Candidatus Hydrogenedentes bacterium]|nr:molybdate ABC transporter permease subunit [Candidatus Hydrogenedentota bacterium]
LPLARRGLVSAATLGFAHTLGEFGVVLMIGGSIPGRTKVISIAIYDAVESSNYPLAHQMSALMLVASFLLLFTVYWMNRRPTRQP